MYHCIIYKMVSDQTEAVYDSEITVIRMDEKKIARINELYKKSKTPAGLTPAEKEEQKNLRQEYIFAMKQNLRSVLNNIDIKEPDGSITRLEDIDPTKKV